MITYTDWLVSVKALLTHPDAIKCTFFADDSILMAWHERGDSTEKVSQELNERYRRGYDDREMVRQWHE